MEWISFQRHLHTAASSQQPRVYPSRPSGEDADLAQGAERAQRRRPRAPEDGVGRPEHREVEQRPQPDRRHVLALPGAPKHASGLSSEPP